MRWIKMAIDWQSSEWLAVLSVGSRLTWWNVLCHVKGYGFNGCVRAVTPIRFAQMTFVGEEDVRQLLIAAEQSGAIRIADGHWTIVKWQEYQGDSTGATRQSRFRENKSQVQRNGGNALRNEENERENERESEREIILATPKQTKSAFTEEEAISYGEEIGLSPAECSAFYDHHLARGFCFSTGKPIRDWKACCRTWKRNAEKFGKASRAETLLEKRDRLLKEVGA